MSNKTTVGIACNITTGKLDSNHAVKNGKYPFFTCAAEPDKINTYAFDDNVVLIAGNNAQGNFHINRYKGKFNAYQRTYVLTAKDEFDIDFIYYSLKLELKRLKEKSQGSQTKFLTMPILTNIILNGLKKNDQKKIGAVLFSLDAKIELNNRINAVLEAMAKTLYDYWFVQFDFPDKNGKPYKSSGGKMVWNEQLKREIPEGWEVKSLKDILDNVTESITPQQDNSNMPYTPIDSLPMRRMSFGSGENSSEAKTSLILYKENDILIGAMRVYFHRVCIAPFRGITRTTMIVLRPKNNKHLPIIYQICNEEKTIRYASQISVGTQQPYVKWEKSFENYLFPYPGNDKLYSDYSLKMHSTYNKVVLLEKENAELASIRDWLLPMLMNGQVKVVK